MQNKNIYKKELIGKFVKIINSKNVFNKNIEGIVVDETYHTIKIKHDKQIKTLFKKNIIFKMTVDENQVVIKGENFEKRPHDRLKVNC
jgi:RNase P/RNase MRP subunit p29